MQQAIYNSINSTGINSTGISGNGISIQTDAAVKTGTSAPKASGLLRWVVCRWDLIGVLTLMGSSAAYGVFALAHVGL